MLTAIKEYVSKFSKQPEKISNGGVPNAPVLNPPLNTAHVVT